MKNLMKFVKNTRILEKVEYRDADPIKFRATFPMR